MPCRPPSAPPPPTPTTVLYPQIREEDFEGQEILLWVPG